MGSQSRRHVVLPKNAPRSDARGSMLYKIEHQNRRMNKNEQFPPAGNVIGALVSLVSFLGSA
jgi:hypothetical protein